MATAPGAPSSFTNGIPWTVRAHILGLTIDEKSLLRRDIPDDTTLATDLSGLPTKMVSLRQSASGQMRLMDATDEIAAARRECGRIFSIATINRDAWVNIAQDLQNVVSKIPKAADWEPGAWREARELLRVLRTRAMVMGLC